MSARLQVILAMQHDVAQLERQRDEWESSTRVARTPSERSHARFMLNLKERELQSALRRKFRYMEDQSFATSTGVTPTSASPRIGLRLFRGGPRTGLTL